MDLLGLQRAVTYVTDEQGKRVVQIPYDTWQKAVRDQVADERQTRARDQLREWAKNPPLPNDEVWHDK